MCNFASAGLNAGRRLADLACDERNSNEWPPRASTSACNAGASRPVAIQRSAPPHSISCSPPTFRCCEVGGTLGGCVATGWSGPRRAYAGAVRDFVIGVQIVDGQGERLRFGGRVIKNVAGYDVSRLMVGAHGALGVLLEISLRVLPGK